MAFHSAYLKKVPGIIIKSCSLRKFWTESGTGCNIKNTIISLIINILSIRDAILINNIKTCIIVIRQFALPWLSLFGSKQQSSICTQNPIKCRCLRAFKHTYTFDVFRVQICAPIGEINISIRII